MDSSRNDAYGTAYWFGWNAYLRNRPVNDGLSDAHDYIGEQNLTPTARRAAAAGILDGYLAATEAHPRD